MDKVSNAIQSYLKELRNNLMFGRCAGKTTRLSKLHQNRLTGEESRLTAINNLFNVIKAITSVRILDKLYQNNSSVTGIESIIEIHNIFISHNWDSDFNIQYDQELRTKNLVDELTRFRTFEQFEEILNSFNEVRIIVDEEFEKIQSVLNSDKGGISEEISRLENELQYEYQKREELLSTNKLIVPYARKKLADNAERISVIMVAIGKQQAKLSELSIKKFDAGELKVIEKFLATEPIGFDNIPLLLEEIKYGTYDLSKKLDQNIDATTLKDRRAGIYTIFGDPGWGKTIQLRQFTEKFVYQQIKNKINHKIPIYVKANILAEKIGNIATDKYGIAIQQPDGNTTEHYGKSTSNRHEMTEICKQAILESEPNIESELIDNLFDIQRDIFANMILIIDAYDEVSNEESRYQLLSFINDNIERHNCPVIITSRKSHKKELISGFNSFNDEINPLTKLEIHFTAHELRFIMPTKLANAWGINSDQLSAAVSEQFNSYQEVLSHPLFIGLFCMLLNHKSLPLNPKNHFPSFNVNKKPTRVTNLHAPLTLPHISFLTQVIDFGLRININERKDVSEKIVNRIRKIFCYVAATYQRTGLKNIDQIFAFIEKFHDVSVTEEEKKIMKNNLGIIFINDEHQIQWTHPNIAEVAMGLLISEDKKFREYLTSKQGSLFGNGLWSEALFMTVIFEDLKDYANDENDESLSNIISEIIPKLGSREMWQTLNMFDLRATNCGFSNITYDGKAFTFVAYADTPEKIFILNIIGKVYFSQLVNGNPFRIPSQFFGAQLDMSEKDGLLKNLFDLSKPGYVDALLHPTEVGFPNIGNEEILEKFSHNYPLMLSFYMNRKSVERKIFSDKKRQSEFVQTLIDKILEEELQISFPVRAPNSLRLISNCLNEETDLILLNTILVSSVGAERYISHNQISEHLFPNVDKYFLKHINEDRDGDDLSSKWLIENYPAVFSAIINLFIEMIVDPSKKHRLYRDIIESWGFAREKGTEYSLSTLFSDPMTSEKIPKWFPIERLMKKRISPLSNIYQHKTIGDDTMIL